MTEKQLLDCDKRKEKLIKMGEKQTIKIGRIRNVGNNNATDIDGFDFE